MNSDCLKLTTYFGERDRTEHHLLADKLLDLYGQHQIEASILLRGIEGFGVKHHMHTDLLLTLSEDLPVVSVAVDARERIEGLLNDVIAIKRRGLVTLERARMLSGEIATTHLPEELGEATKLTVYVGRQEQVYGTAAFIAVCDLLHRQRQRARFFSRNAEVPLMIISVGPGGQIARVLPELSGLLRSPLLTLERVRLCKRDGELLLRPHELPGADEHGLALWQKLMVHTSEDAQVGRRTLHRELVRRLRAANVAGATSVRGIWGFHGDHRPHGDRLLQARRRVPVVTIIIDRPDRIATAFDIVDELTAERGLVTSEMVPAAAALLEDERRGGFRLARHPF
jgi:PII-like signaling protein